MFQSSPRLRLSKQPKHHTNMKTSKFYSIALFQNVQGKTIRICALETWFFSTRKREAQVQANRYNRDHNASLETKWAAVEVLGA